MKAAVVVEPGRLEIWDIAMPLMGEYDALVEILYGATCIATDKNFIYGRHLRPVQYPMLLGHESVGRVVETGKKVRNFRVGDLVTDVGCPPTVDGLISSRAGGFAQFGIVKDFWQMQRDGLPREQWEKNRSNRVIPDWFDPAGATMMTPYRETLSYVRRIGAGKGKRVLILGSGCAGLCFAAHSHNEGAHAVVMVGTPAREPLANKLGVQAFYSYRDSNIYEQIQANHGLFDVIIDAVGVENGLSKALHVLREGGVCGVYGWYDWDANRIDPLKVPRTFMYYAGGYDQAETHDDVVSYMKSGLLDPSDILTVDMPYALDNIMQAYSDAWERKVIKSVVKIKP